MNPTFKTLPATCELCGNWLPGHSTSCPRNGVHPSQWSLGIDEVILTQEQESIKSFFDEDFQHFELKNDDEKKDKQIKKLSL